MLIAVVLWLVFAVVVGVAAGARGRSGVGWLLLAVLISPLIAGLILAILPDLQVRAMLTDIRDGHRIDDRALKRNIRKGRRDA